MLSKVLTGGFILIMIGAVVAGAIAVLNPSEEHVSAAGRGQGLFDAQTGSTVQGRGQGAGGEGQGYGREQGQGQGQGLSQEQGQGQGRGQGQGQGQGQDENLATEAYPVEVETIEGVVVETDELVVETASGETVQVGLGPSMYRETQGFVLQTGEDVRVSGYWEDDEFKATQLENLTTGNSIVLRDDTGRPMWAGQGRGRNRIS